MMIHMKGSTSNTWMSVTDAAAVIRRTPGRIRQMLIAGEIDGYKVHERCWLIKSKEVMRVKRMLQSQEK